MQATSRVHRPILAVLLLVACACARTGRRSAGDLAGAGDEADPSRIDAMMDDGMGSARHVDDVAMRLHMVMSPTRRATHADSARALAVAAELRRAIARYDDTARATAAGYRMFLPNVKDQRIYHFTSYRNAFLEAFRFDPGRPTSLLYRRANDGRLRLVGAMYGAPVRTSLAKLDARIPLSIGRWHQHVNWCLPARGEEDRWFQRRNGRPLFGPESPIATRAACDDVGGRFREHLFGWMIHVNALDADDRDLGAIYAERG